MRILLTGAGGMVGRNLLECPKLKGYEWLCPTRQELDLQDAVAVKKWMQNLKLDLVVHCAGRVGGIQANIKAPVEFLVENMDMGRNVLLGAHQAGIRRVLNMGSTCMFPRNAPNPLREEMVLQGELEPTNEGYALAKIMTQRLAAYLNRQYGTQFKTLIPCNLYGRWDKFDPAHSHLVPAVLRKLHEAKLNGLHEVDIWGDGLARREFMDAADLADFVDMAIKRFDELPDLLNVGLGFDYSITDYYHSAAKVVGYQGSYKHDLTKPVGMKQKLASVERLVQFGWKAPTSLEQGLQRAYQFFLENN